MIAGTVSILGTVREVEAQELEQELDFTEQLVERGHTGATYQLGNSGQFKSELGLDPWVFDESQGRYVPHTVDSLPDGTLQVRSGMIGWIIGPESAVITDPEGKEERAREVWRVYLGEQELDKQFDLQTVTEYDNVVRVLNRYDVIMDGTRAVLSITYAVFAGKPTERIVQILGVSDELKSQVRIEREWHDIDTDELLYATSESENGDDVTLTRKTITPDETGEYVRLMKADKLVVHENLRTAGDKLQSVEYERELVRFAYSGWESKTTLKLTDDTYSTSSGTFNYVNTSSATGSSCPSPSSTGAGPSTIFTFLGASGSSTFCRLMFFDWGVEYSLVPANATVTSTTFKFQVSTSNNAINCDVVALTSNRPGTSSASTIWNDILGGSAYVSNNNFCTTTGTNKSLTLGSTANTDVQNRQEEWFAIGIRFVDMTRDTTARDVRVTAVGGTPTPTLEVVYTVPQSYDRTPADTITFSDSISVVLAAGRSGADSWITSESIARLYQSFRSIAETATINDSAARKLLASRSTSDTLTTTDSITATFKPNRGASDSWTTNDAITNTYSANRPTADLFTTSDSIAVMLDAARAPSDSLTISDSIGAVYVEAVEIPITLNAGSGSPTFQDKGVSATISCQYGGSHDGDPAQQEFQCFAGETVNVSLPASTATERWIWSNGSTGDMSFSACLTGTCDEQTFTYYLQELQTVTLQGLDAIRTASVTRTQLGSQGTTAVSGSTLTPIWADYGTPFSIPDIVVIVANEYRFKSYDGASYLSYTVDDAYTKTPTYQREFNILFRIHEEHEGVIFAPMPPAVFTGTIEAADSQLFNLTFDTQVTDDHLQPSTGRVWIVNGTAMWQNITWQGIVVNETGSAPITEYGNFDIESSSKHLGFDPEQHFRIAVNNASAITDVAFDRLNNRVTFTAEASGIQDVKLEFLIDIFDDVQSVSVDGEMLPVGRWSVVKPGGGVAYLTVEDVEFSFHEFLVIFNPSGAGAGGSSGGGAGGSTSGSGIIDFFNNPLQNVPIIIPQTREGLRVSVPVLNISPGETQHTTMTIYWPGASILEVTSIQFLDNPEWFTIDAPLPHVAILQPDNTSATATIPISVTVPKEVRGVGQSVSVQVIATSSGVVASTIAPVQLTYTSTANLALIFGAILAVVIGVGVAGRAYSRRTVH